MITVTLRLAQSLRCILADAGNEQPEVLTVEVEPGTRIREVMHALGINPLLVPMVVRDKQKIDITTPLDMDTTLTFHGPLAGG